MRIDVRLFLLTRGWLAMASLCGVAACDSPVQPSTYTVGGEVSGLAGSGLVLVNNGGDSLAVSANGPVTFASALAEGAGYRVTVLAQPTAPTQTCFVSGGSGTVTTANVTTVAVACFMAGAASPFVVSSPVPVGGSLTVVYVSLPPGTIPSGFTATISCARTGRRVDAAMVDGGFDPVALPAIEGDTLVIAVRATGGASLTSFLSVVAAATAPSVVRTGPPPHKRNVSPRSIVAVVFSEPLDPSTVDTASFKLRRGTTPVLGTLRFADVAYLRVEFYPDSLLASQTDYQLVLSHGIRDVNGLALDSAVTVPFTTGTIAPVTNLVFASLSAGLSHTCGVTTAGAAYCWGANFTGALGDGTTAGSTTPVPVAGGHTFSAVSAGSDHTCGVTTAGALYCWGDGTMGPGEGWLGHGPTPESVGGSLAFAAVSVGAFHACGVTTAGAAYCWGYGGSGELGDGATASSTNPVAVAGGLTFAAVSAGTYSTCGVTTTGAAYCWGDNSLGGLGTGTSTGLGQCGFPCSTVPAAVTGGLTFRQVDAKVYAACGVATSGTAYCWGSNLNDALGFGTQTGPDQCAWGDETLLLPCSRVPLPVPGSPNLVSLSDADSYTCGLTSAGVAYCWGYPQSVGYLSSNHAPVAVPGGLTFKALSAGSYSTCGMTTGGVAYCWGNNFNGQLGDGTTLSSSVPVKVAGQP
jgi:alpha-tubulin suppressor-like RCC1 family protein